VEDGFELMKRREVRKYSGDALDTSLAAVRRKEATALGLHVRWVEAAMEAVHSLAWSENARAAASIRRVISPQVMLAQLDEHSVEAVTRSLTGRQSVCCVCHLWP
jgi:hypothetical protein